ncbi:hypothetical protein BKA83DRAFT_1977932 [Pisolithus microcarpus]|nr:hypothetical protein BKA83DRAFT_1977932 [Pisolithus microcarpus]
MQQPLSVVNLPVHFHIPRCDHGEKYFLASFSFSIPRLITVIVSPDVLAFKNILEAVVIRRHYLHAHSHPSNSGRQTCTKDSTPSLRSWICPGLSNNAAEINCLAPLLAYQEPFECPQRKALTVRSLLVDKMPSLLLSKNMVNSQLVVSTLPSCGSTRWQTFGSKHRPT